MGVAQPASCLDPLPGLALFLSIVLAGVWLTLPKRYGSVATSATRARESSAPPVSVQVLVLGDIGRSPRMQYHAISIAKHGGQVEVIGYTESETHPDLNANPRVQITPLVPAPRFLQTGNRLLFLAFAPLKVIWQVIALYHALGYKAAPAEWLLVQNPPSIPTLAVAQLTCFLRSTKLIIDWHNFGYSILALKLGWSHPLVRISKFYERIFARSATSHLTVTAAMARVLNSGFGITALPLHDRPPAYFQPLTSHQRAAFLTRLPETAGSAGSILEGKTKLIVSSTSWTADEDFSILLDALVCYSADCTSRSDLPRVLVIITGKGPLKQHYLSKIEMLAADQKLLNVSIVTAWLSTEDYASLLGAADLGVSLHTSSSGVDLPMKVVDMFGTGLPVVGWGEFEAWPELVQEGINGRGFGSADELLGLLTELFEGNGKQLQKLREGAQRECSRRWDDEWDPVAGKLLQLEPHSH